LTDNIRTSSSDEALVRERRDQFIKCAAKVFYEKGYPGATIRELAQACGMAQGTIYHYLGSKEDILHLICVSRSRGVKGLRELLHDLGNVSCTEAVCRCMEKHFQGADSVAQDNIFFNREISNFSRDDRRVLLESQIDIRKFFEQLIIEGVQAGEFKVDSPALVAHNIMMMGHDWGLRRWFSGTCLL